MLDINQAIRELVNEAVEERLGSLSASVEPALISVDDAAKICDNCDKSVILALVKEREKNGFPAVVLGKRTIKIDKHRLAIWFANGGLRKVEA